MGTIYAIWLREMKRFFRAKSRVVGNLSMPFIWLVLMGVGLNSSFTIPGMDVNIIEFLAPGIISMSLLFTSIFSGISVIWDKQFGFLKEMLVAPVPRTHIILGKVVGSSTISLINGILILLLSAAIGAIPLSLITPLSIGISIVFMILISVVFVSLGLIIAAKLDNTEGFQMIMSFLVMPLFFLSGAFFPLKNAPLWMKGIAYIDPLYYGVNGIRESLIGVSETTLMASFGVLIGFCISFLLIATYMFRRIR